MIKLVGSLPVCYHGFGIWGVRTRPAEPFPGAAPWPGGAAAASCRAPTALKGLGGTVSAFPKEPPGKLPAAAFPSCGRDRPVQAGLPAQGLRLPPGQPSSHQDRQSSSEQRGQGSTGRACRQSRSGRQRRQGSSEQDGQGRTSRAQAEQAGRVAGGSTGGGTGGCM